MESTTLVLQGDGELIRRTVEVPALGPGDLLLQVSLAGVCGSDVHMWKHDMDLTYPVVPGHELVGEIVACGDEVRWDAARQPIAEGDTLTVVPGMSCEDCWYCENMPTRPLTCNDRDVHGFRSLDEPPHLHGGMSEYMVVEDRADYYRLPDAIPTELGALVEPLSVATHAIERAYPPGLPNVREGLGLGRSVVVQGAGPIGLLTAAAAATGGAGQVIVLDLLPERLRLAERFGATDTIDVSDLEDDAVIEEVAARTPSGEGPDVAIEAVGQPAAFEQALALPHNGGTVVEVGHYFSAGEVAIDPSDLIRRQLDIYGSLAYPPSTFETSITLLERTSERFPYEDLLNHRVSIDDAHQAFAAQASGDAYRASIHP